MTRPQLKEWRAKAHEIIFDDPRRAGCSLSDDWRTGTVKVGLREGHPQVRKELEAAIPAEHLSISEGGCPRAM